MLHLLSLHYLHCIPHWKHHTGIICFSLSPMNHLRQLGVVIMWFFFGVFFWCVKTWESTNTYKALQARQILTIHIQFFHCGHLLKICLSDPEKVMTTVIKSLQESFSHWSAWTNSKDQDFAVWALNNLGDSEREKMWIRGKTQMSSGRWRRLASGFCNHHQNLSISSANLVNVKKWIWGRNILPC